MWNKKTRQHLFDAMDAICYHAIGGECCGIGEIAEEDNLDKVEQHLERLEINAEDNGDLNESTKELFQAAHHIIEAIRKDN